MKQQTLLLMAKIGSMFVLGLGSLLMGMLPLLIGQYKRRRLQLDLGCTCPASPTSLPTQTITKEADPQQKPELQERQEQQNQEQGLLKSLLLCFGGGVLLFTTFLHLAPEVRQSVERHQFNGQLIYLGSSLSLSELLFCGGFFLVYLVEETVHAALSNSDARPGATNSNKSETLLYRTVSVRRCSHHHRNHNQNNQNNNNNNNSRAWGDSDQEADDLELQLKTLTPSSGGTSSSHGHANLRSLLTVLALSFHAIFEGLAVGLEPAFGSVLYLAAAIATHKLVISFCVGMELWVAGASNRSILGYLSVFALVTPLGIGLGLVLGTDGGSLGPTPTVLQAMAAGTLLYVVFFEVLARERANDQSGLLQLAFILLGFLLMLALQIVTSHSHDHSNQHGGAVESTTNHDHEHHLVTAAAAAAIERVTEEVLDSLSTTLTS